MAGMHIKFTYGSYDLVIPANPYPAYPRPRRLNYIAEQTSTGTIHAVDNGPTVILCEIPFRFLDRTTVSLIEEFFLSRVRLSLRPFAVSCPDYYDLGLGMGVDVPAAQYAAGNDLSAIISARDGAGFFFDAKIPITYVR